VVNNPGKELQQLEQLINQSFVIIGTVKEAFLSILMVKTNQNNINLKVISYNKMN